MIVNVFGVPLTADPTVGVKVGVTVKVVVWTVAVVFVSETAETLPLPLSVPVTLVVLSRDHAKDIVPFDPQMVPSNSAVTVEPEQMVEAGEVAITTTGLTVNVPRSSTSV